MSFVGCKAKQVVTKSEYSSSVSIEDSFINHTITIARDSARLQMPLFVDRNNDSIMPVKATARGKRSSVAVEITSDGELIAQANCDEYLEQVKLLQRTIMSREKQIIELEEEKRGFVKFMDELKSTIKYIVALIIITAICYFVFYKK